ncbi:LysR family transcriptional regulator [Stenotrophomonas mori]|uniref:LysR family transcriptional regulator n=1 Tax=Stenotrophomonas mori TaxID=2871096 RepID=A0ABT0SFM8_9GAMM|nr:LysR family transcriptional regulator [Stenotrophomonas mori]MCL7714129.1 LysR family transcriptional regulator [Stenotrophomonas mori]
MKELPSLPPLHALRAFEATARLRSVSLAAAELHVTHGAVSRQLRVLEDALGVALFERDGRGIRPNAAGRRLQEAASGAFSQLRDCVAALRRAQRNDVLVLGCPGSVLARWMIPRLQQLQDDLPGLTLHLAAQEGDFAPQLAGLDAALLLGQAPWPAGWTVHGLGSERIGPVFSPAMPGAGPLARQPPQALLGQALLHTHSRPQAWPTWAALNGLEPGALRQGTGFAHLYYLLEAAVAGLGVAIAPYPLVAGDLANGRLVAPWGFVDTDGHWALCTVGDARHPRIEALADWLRRQLADA